MTCAPGGRGATTDTDIALRAEGASFVLREGELCYYAEEDAISALWQGMRFPMSSCVSGWVMQNGAPAIVDDIALDPRIPLDVYRPTFVRSMAMVPVNARAPLGALGSYWGSARAATAYELTLLQALADGAALAMETIALRERADDTQARLTELEAATRELEERHRALADSQRQNDSLNELLAHDLRSPAAGILLTATARLRDRDIPERDRRRWKRVLCSRLDDGGASPSAGRGLGLTFCKLAVEAHGGTIQVRDNEGRGSCFSVLLPA
ncbi:GAF domain-containing protein [Sorangium sp. So ce1389]|uniref:GAF domain-containing protein n=1 Tax=Sorangium sp. So ce1389 TaxID=3133336 RepID=UPI003F62121A